MLAAQAIINAALFGFFAFSFLPRGPFSKAFLIFAALTVGFIASAILAKSHGRLILICTWIFALVAITPHLPGGFMEGGFVSFWLIAYMLAGLVGAAFLPVRDSPTPGAPP